MIPYFHDGLRLYLGEGVDWDSYFTLRKGDGADVDGERSALFEILETAAQICGGLEPELRAGWSESARLEGDEVVYPPHIEKAYQTLASAGLVSFGVEEQYGGFGIACRVISCRAAACGRPFRRVTRAGTAGLITSLPASTRRREAKGDVH